MKYAELLSFYIAESGLSLSKISDALKAKGFSTDKGYISKLQNAKISPAGEELTRAIAEVTGGDAEKLILAAYLDKAPEEVKKHLEQIIEKTMFHHHREQQHNPILFIQDISSSYQFEGKEIVLTPEEAIVFQAMKNHPKFPLMFQDLAKDPEKKVEVLIKMWEVIKSMNSESTF